MASESGRTRLLSVVCGVVFLAVGIGVAGFGLFIWRLSPTHSLNATFGQAWGAAGIATALAGFVFLGFPRWPAKAPSRTWTARWALVAAVLSLGSLITFVLRGVTWGEDATMSDAALFIAAPLGAIAVILGVWGIASAKGDGFSLRWSLASLVLGVVTAALPIWLRLTFPSVFTSYYGQ